MAAAHEERGTRHRPAGETTEPSAEGAPSGYTLRYSERPIGNGSFGFVFDARIEQTGRRVAVKKVLRDPAYKMRELPVHSGLGRHANVVELLWSFKSKSRSRPDEEYLNLVMEFLPETVHRVIKEYVKRSELPPLSLVKLYTYQMLRSLAFIHTRGVCHRDIKPQNLLVDPRKAVLKLCDFGSAKKLQPGQPNVAYICSRYYRAPELIFGATDYTVAIDVWSAGCVFAEMLLGSPLFPGDSGVGQLVEIIKVMGTPTRAQIHAMNPSYTDFSFPDIEATGWSRVFRGKPTPPEDALDLLEKLLTYVPRDRITAFDALAHPFFDDLRDPSFRLPDGTSPPPLFDLTEEELSANPALRTRLIPEWYTEAVGGGASSSSAAAAAAAEES